MMVYLLPGYTTPSQPGRHSGGAKPLERLRFWSLNRNTILITFILVISYTSWWLNTAAPEGTPPRRIDDEKFKKNFPALLCLGEALKRVSILLR
jgi:hypothetical protein